MRNIVVVIGILFFLVMESGFSQGIDFKHITFEEALEVAKKEDKFIFIDFYTQWCGPCKKLAKGPFMDPEVGNYYNKHFINLKLDAEKEGLKTAQKYKVAAYPTLIFVNADGDIIYKSIGVKYIDNMVQLGEEAINSVYDKYNLENIKEEFAKKQHDEKFLKFYIQKMTEYGMNPLEGIEAWLKVQTEIKEGDPAMLTFLQKHRKYLILNTKAAEVLKNNKEAYSIGLTERQQRPLNSLYRSIYQNTLRLAYRTQNPELLKVYIEKSRENEEEIKVREELNWLNVEYFRMNKDYPIFMTEACKYVDSLKNAVSLKEIREKDKKLYESIGKSYEKDTSAMSQAMLTRYKTGRNAIKQVEKIVEAGHYYLQVDKNGNHLKPVEKWIAYCEKLTPNYYEVENLKADLLYVQGKTDKAIQLKEMTLKNFPSNYKKLVNIEYQLELMKKGEDLFKNH